MDKCAYVKNDGKVIDGNVARLRPSCEVTVYFRDWCGGRACREGGGLKSITLTKLK